MAGRKIKTKADWEKTTLPRYIKVNFHWKALADTINYRTWVNRMAEMDWSKDGRYYRVSWDIYNQLREELMEMPETEIHRLPIYIQSWIAERRGIILKEPELIGSISVSKEVRDHIDEIKRRIKAFENIMQFPSNDLLCSLDVSYTDAVEFQISIVKNGLEEHLPFPELWNNVKNWENEFKKYVKYGHELINGIRQDSNKLLEDQNILEITHAFDRPILDWIYRRGKPGKIEYSYMGEVGEQMLLADKVVVLRAKDAVLASSRYQDIADKYFNMRQFIRFRRVFSDLQRSGYEISTFLSEFLITNEYYKYTCDSCPKES